MNALGRGREADTSWKPIFVGCLIIGIFMFVGCSLTYWLPQLHNNQQLRRFAARLYDYPLPLHSEVVSRNAEVGWMGNGNHCDFLAEQTIVTNLSPAEIESYYTEVMLPPVNNHNEGVSPEYKGLPIPVIVTFAEQTSGDGRLLVTLTLLDYGYKPGLDIRCH